MRSTLYLRDARHLDKFIYTFVDKLFYDKFENHYQPSDEYLVLVTDFLKSYSDDWTIRREGFWTYVYAERFIFPPQGWKIHVSATLANAASILQRTAKIVLDNNIPFKFACDKRTLSLFNSKRWQRGASGKFLTIYPTDISSFKSLLEQLYAELHHDEGPYILSDQRYRDCRVLYYRYGGIARVTRMETFRDVFKNFTQAVKVLHERGILFGDLSGTNIKIDPSTYTLRLIDFESAFRPGVDKLTYLYTPGFRDPLSARKGTLTVEDDLYALGAIMLYMLFPLPALSSLRDDLYHTVLKILLDDLGWSNTAVFKIINGLSKGTLTCAEVYELLDKPAQILPPHYDADVDADDCEMISRELGSFTLANMRAEKGRSLFPSDPFALETNNLSLGFGACGVLYALKKSGYEIPPSADWLEEQLENAKAENLPPGLLTGAAGIAWSLWEIGLEDRAAAFIKMANESALLRQHHSYLYGMAGIGMANLFFYLRTKDSNYLDKAGELAESLLQTAHESDKGLYWESNNLLHIGLGYGQSGVALFFLRLFQLTGQEKYLLEGRSALEFDLAHGIEIEEGVLSFPRTPEAPTTHEPYLEEGSAGIAKVAMRYGLWDRVDPMLADAHRKYSVYAGLLFGLGGFVDVFTDAFLFSKDVKYLELAKRPIAGIRDIYLVKQSVGSTTPGDGLFRSSCDYATGSAGVMRALHRFAHLEEADFVLDEVVSFSPDFSPVIDRKYQEKTVSTVFDA